ncbi:MAG TPA: glycosyltransferase family 39 protein [Vicinamibacterales bacterium]
MNRSVLTLLILCVITFFLGLGRQAITDSDEGYYAEASREMVDSGDWLTPRFNYENRFEKPPLYYWLTAATYLVTGPTEGAARFWSAMSGAGLALLTWAIAGGRRRPEASWLAAAIVATSFGCFTMARWALPDLPLAFFITLTIWVALRAAEADSTNRSLKWWAIAGLSAGLGFLTKGPVSLVIPAIVLVPIWWWKRRVARLDPRGLALAALVFVIVGVPWYVLMWRVHGNEYLRGFFVGDNMERFATTRFNDARPIWYYAPVLIGGLLPWSPFLLTFIWRPMIAIAMVRRRARFSDLQWGLILWAVMPLLFYTLSIGKQPRYILPVLPPVAILLAQAISERIAASRTDDHRRQPGLAGATWATSALYIALALLFVRMQPLFISTYAVLTWTAAGLALCAAIAFAVVAATQAWTRLPAVGATAAAALLIAVQFGALSGRRPEAVEQMAALVLANRSGNEPVALYNVFIRNLTFYTRLEVVQPFDVKQAVGLLRSSQRLLLVASADDVKAIQAALGTPLHTLGSVRYMNTANIRVGTLVQSQPDDVTDVLLVVNH